MKPKTRKYKILGDTWTETVTDKMRSGEGNLKETDAGQCFQFTQEILLSAEMCPSKLSQTRRHEILHAISWRLGLELNESQIDGLVYALPDVAKTAKVDWNKR